MPLALRPENRTTVYCLILALSQAAVVWLEIDRQHLADHRRYVRCVDFDKPNVEAIRAYMRERAKDPKVSAAALAYLKATEQTIKNSPCADIPDAAVQAATER